MKYVDIDLDKIVSVLWELYKENQKPLCKVDVNECEYLPSYNTCMRRGLVLHKVNAEFSHKLYIESPKLCRNCTTAIPYKRRHNDFCSRSCSAKVNNAARTPKTSNIKSICINCLSDFYPTRTSAKKFCCHQCSADYKVESNFLDWYLHDKYFENRIIRNFLKILHGYSCSVCGISDWNGRDIVLEVEHISGDSTDSSKDNVCLICPNCHSQTPTYKGKNSGNGRHSRRVRYQEGKSY